MPKCLIVGLGNPLLGDDGIGWKVAEAVQSEMASSPSGDAFEIEIDYLATGGLSLMERLIGYDYAILIDAITTGQAPAGVIFSCQLDDLVDRKAGHLSSAHDASLQQALAIGRAMGAPLPKDIFVLAVEAERIYDFSEELSPALAAAVPAAVTQVDRLLRQFE
jgi:hydrogenase maturation protease